MSLTHTCMWNNSEIIVYVKYFFHIRMWGLGLSLYVMLGTIVFIILLLVYMVGSVVFGQFRQLQKNQTKSMIHPSLTCPPWRHVVWINRLRYIQLPAQTSYIMIWTDSKYKHIILWLWRARSRLELFHIQARQCMWNNCFTYVCAKKIIVTI